MNSQAGPPSPRVTIRRARQHSGLWLSSTGLLLALGGITPGAETAAAGVREFEPQEDREVVLHNPDMGWVLYENFPLDPRPDGSGTLNVLPQATFEGCDHVAVMFTWADVSKEEGKIDWSRVDQACHHWRARGKQIQLRLSTEPLFAWSRLQPPGGMGVPDWLLAKIPPQNKAQRHNQTDTGWHVDARNLLYQKYLREFLRAVNDHFDGPDDVRLVDLRGHGRWGEWHSGYPYQTLAQKREALAAVLEIWTTSFAGRSLALSYSHDPDGPRDYFAGPWHKLDPAFTNTYQDYVRFSAFDLAFEMPGITWRRDGAGGAVSPNERLLCEHVYRVLRRAPLVSEFVCGYASAGNGGNSFVEAVVDDALSLHPNYIGLLGYGGKDAIQFMAERPDLFARGLRRMGYRLVPLKVTLPAEINSNTPFPLHIEWTNRGVGRALRDFHLRLRLTAEDGAPLGQADAGALPTSHWLQGDTTITKSMLKVDTGSRARATAKVLIGLHDPATGQTIALPLAKRARDGFCEVGTIAIRPADPTDKP